MTAWTRRNFLKHSTAAVMATGPLLRRAAAGARAADKPGAKMRFGLVTYLWGQDWDLPTLIANCEKTGVLGLETRTEHAHKVEPSLSAAERLEVKKRFADSPVVFVGPGTNQQYDDPEPEKLAASIEGTKAFIKLSHDCGGSGVKVKPNSFHKNVPREVTIEQIGKSLNKVGAFAADYGQEIRLEVHGTCAELPVIKSIMDLVDQKNVGVCWNCNAQDLQGEGLEFNFNLVKSRFGATAVRERTSMIIHKWIGMFMAMTLVDLLEAGAKPAADRGPDRGKTREMVAGAQAKVEQEANRVLSSCRSLGTRTRGWRSAAGSQASLGPRKGWRPGSGIRRPEGPHETPVPGPAVAVPAVQEGDDRPVVVADCVDVVNP